MDVLDDTWVRDAWLWVNFSSLPKLCFPSLSPSPRLSAGFYFTFCPPWTFSINLWWAFINTASDALGGHIHVGHNANCYLFCFVKRKKREKTPINIMSLLQAHFHFMHSLIPLLQQSFIHSCEINGRRYQYLPVNATQINIEIRVWNILNKCYVPANCF